MDDYKPNSKLYKKEQEAAPPEKKLEKVVTGNVKVKKKNSVTKFASNFISDDAKNIKTFIVTDFLIPTAKRLISDVVDIVLYGDKGNRRKVNNGNYGYATPKINYGKMFDRGDERRDSVPARRHFDYDDLEFQTRGEADYMLDQMFAALDYYKSLSIADMYDMAGMTPPEWTYQKYGWTSLEGSSVKRSGGGYVLDLPPAKALS